MGALLLPHQPPLCSADLPTVGGRPGAEPEDFVVDEIPLYPASGKGEHWFVRVRKRLRTTPDMIEAVARAAGVSARDVGYAGMKDKQAVTTQWISVPAGCHRVEAWALPLGIEVLETARHDNKLRTGHLLANHFRIRLVGVQDEPLPRARAILHRLTERGLPNYFGAQRFGRDGSNLSLAVEWLLNGGQNKRGKRGRFYAKLYPSVIQAEVFNRYLSARLERGGDRLLEGDVVRLAGTSSVFRVEDPERELHRLVEGDVVLTGPICGPKAQLHQGEPLQMVEAAFSALGLRREDIHGWGKLAPGTWRDLMVRPDCLDVTQKETGTLTLEFTLPSGSYATEVLRELTHCRAPACVTPASSLSSARDAPSGRIPRR